MDKEYEIEGLLLLKEEISADQLTERIIEFVESNEWFFGGGLNELKKSREFSIQGCISVGEQLSSEYFKKALQDCFESNKCDFQGSINEIIDGYYIKQDGTRGKHVLDES